MQLNTQPTLVGATAVDLLSGASLSGLVGAASPSPRIRVKSVSIVTEDPNIQKVFNLYKGASGGSASGTEVFQGFAAPLAISNLTVIPVDVILEAGEYLTALSDAAGGVGVVATVSAEITF